MTVKNIESQEQLDRVLAFFEDVFQHIEESEHLYSRDFWREKMGERPELLLYAEEGGTLAGAAFSREDGGGLTVGQVAVSEGFRKRGVGRALMLETERRGKALGFTRASLGAVEEAEGFYEALGYTGCLLIQSKEHGIDELLALNSGYTVRHTGVYDGEISQLYLDLPRADRELQRRYETELSGCYTQIIYGKEL